MVRSASNPDSKSRRERPLDITEIMRPTAGVIDFSPVDGAESPCYPCYSYPMPSPSYSPSLFSLCPTDPDEAWNLVPYHISWGHDYQDYHAGRLPGPEGDCIFLRSPTPLKNQRTTEACKKCRERKAKCSGGRPACARCEARGFACEYASDLSSEMSEPETPPADARPRKSRRTDEFSSPWSVQPSERHAAPRSEPYTTMGMGMAETYTPIKVESPMSYVPSDNSSPLTPYFDGVRVAGDLELYYPDSCSISYANSPAACDLNAQAYYDSVSFPAYEGVPLSLAHSAIVAPQPVRSQSLLGLESPSPPFPTSSPSSSSSSDIAFDAFSVSSSESGLSLPGPEHVPLSCAEHVDMHAEAQVSQYVYLDRDQAAAMEDPWLHSPHAHATFSDTLTPSMGVVFNGPSQGFVHFS